MDQSHDPPNLEAGPMTEPYRPFPSFREWNASSFDREVFERFAVLLDEARSEVDESRLRRAVETATRWAAVDTGAIEGLYEVDRGFTMSVAVGAAAWENLHERVGREAERAIHDALAGYEYVLDLATDAHPVTEVWIKDLHATLCASQETYVVRTSQGMQDQALPKGAYKIHANNPFNFTSNSVHSYASVADTVPEMARLVEELRSPEFAAAHPVVQAAYAHYAFVCVHPFADGNGRVSRALASAYLYRRPGVPLVIFADQKAEYLDALEAADAGDPSLFLGFVADRVVDTIEMVRVNMRRSGSSSIQDRVRQFAPVLTGREGLPHAEIDAIGTKLVGELAKRVGHVMAENRLEPPWRTKWDQVSRELPAPPGYRWVPNSHVLRLFVNVDPPGEAAKVNDLAVGISLPGAESADFAVYRRGSDKVLLEVFLREVHPTISRALTYRLDVVIEDELARLVDLAAAASRATLEKGGYVPPS